MLTITLTLHGRVAFTERWLRWCALNRCPYPIIVGDSAADNTVERMIRRAEFSGLQIEYIRFPPDRNFRHWFRKLAHVTSRVSTPYVMQADNDDFILFGALGEALQAAAAKPALTVYTRPHYRFGFKVLSTDAAAHLAPLAPAWITRLSKIEGCERLMDRVPSVRLTEAVRHLGYAPFIWYGLCRRDFASEVHQRILAADFSLAMCQEWYFLYSALLRGACLLDDGDPFVARQDGTSSGAAAMYDKERLDYIYMQPTWSRDVFTLIDMLFCDAKRVDPETSYGAFRDSMVQGIWTLGRSKTRYSYWSDLLKGHPIGRLAGPLKQRLAERGRKSLNAVSGGGDVAQLRSFLVGGDG